MSETATNEPTMEEILASIRRIISEDDVPAEAKPEVAEIVAEPEPVPVFEAAAPEPEPEPEPVYVAPPEDDVLELTQPVSRGSISIGDIDAYEPAPIAAPAPVYVPREAPMQSANSLVSDHIAASAVSAFGQLNSATALPQAGRTIEDLLGDYLRPMLQDYLDRNLPGIVEEAVRNEVERIARQARR